MSRSLLIHERIRTTLPKAKELRKFVEPLITLAIKNDLSARREAYKVLENHSLVKKLFDEIGPRYAAQAGGGYTRIVKFGAPRTGDSASMAIIELIQGAEAAEVHETPQAAEAEVEAEAETPAE